MNRPLSRPSRPWSSFADRREAGAALAEHLGNYAGRGTLVLGIPRGGVVVAAEIARRLDADLDVVVARKLGAPGSRELAIGAVTANGGRYLNTALIAELGVTDAYLQRVTAQEMHEARRREEQFRDAQPSPPIAGRIVIVADDGLATGATMRAAVRSVRGQGPAKLVVAAPVGAREACADLTQEADEVVCLHQPEPFYAVGLYYDHFEPVEDADVQQILREFRASRRRESER